MQQLKIKKWRLAGMLALWMGSAVSSAYALPAAEIETYYYTDATYSNEAGYTFLSCQGSSYREGRTTRYRVRYQSPCTSSQPARITCYVDNLPTSCPADICDAQHLFACQ